MKIQINKSLMHGNTTQENFVKNEMLELYGIEISDEKAKEFLKKSDGVFDTLEREKFANQISIELIGMDWPLNGDSEEYKKEFWEKWNALK